MNSDFNMYDSNNEIGKNVKGHAYVFPNEFVSNIKYKSTIPTYVDINNSGTYNNLDYLSNNINNANVTQNVKSNRRLRNGSNYLNESVYSETICTNNSNNKGVNVGPSLNTPHPRVIKCGKSANCLSNFPCLKTMNSTKESTIPNLNRSTNNKRYVVSNIVPLPKQEPYRCNGKTQPPIRSFENIYVATKGIHKYEPQTVVYNNYPMKMPTFERCPNTLHLSEMEIKHNQETYNNPKLAEVQNVKREKLSVDVPMQNYVDKKCFIENMNMQDKQIKELEKSIKEENTLNTLEHSLENQRLKEKLLEQKKKYEDTLKHVKQLQVEKRTLKNNLTVRDKVLNKLENDMNSIDNENNFLLSVKEKTDFKEIHNVFKCLHKNGNDLTNKKVEKTKKLKCKNESFADLGDEVADDDDDDDDSDIYDYDNEEEKEKRTSIKKKKKNYNKKKDKILNENDVYTLKNEILELEKEVRDLKVENKDIAFKYENTFKTLSELRKDTLEYMESIVSRDTRIAYMETSLQKCEKDIFKMREHYAKQKAGFENKIEQCVSEIKVLKRQSSHLQEMIQEKDAQIVLLKSEIVRNETLIKQYENRNKELQSELELMCNNLESVIEASNKKDLYMNELEKELRENEVNRQNAYLKEIAKNRKVQTEIKFKEILHDKSVKNKINEIKNLKNELYINNLHVQKAKDAYKILKRVPQLENLLPKIYGDDCDYDSSSFTCDANEQAVTSDKKHIFDLKNDNTNNEPPKERRTKTLTIEAQKYAKSAPDAKLKTEKN